MGYVGYRIWETPKWVYTGPGPVRLRREQVFFWEPCKGFFTDSSDKTALTSDATTPIPATGRSEKQNLQENPTDKASSASHHHLSC